MRRIFLALVLGATLAAPALAQEARLEPLPQAATPTYTPDPERLPYRHTLRLRDGETRVTTGDVRANDVIISIPVSHRRTGVLREDIRNVSLFGGNAVVIPAGTPGYQAGASGSDASLRGSDIWCFLPRLAQQNFRVDCFADVGANTDSEAVASTTARPSNAFAAPVYYMDGVGSVSAPRVDERSIEFVPDLRMEYVLGRWTRSYAFVGINLNGDRVEELRVRRADDGSAVVNTPLGRLRLRQVSATAMTRAAVALEPYQPLDARTLAAVREYGALMADFRRMLAAPPQPLLRGVSPVTPDAAPRAVEPNAIVFTQMVQPDAAMSQDQTPRARENLWGPPGAALLPVRRGKTNILCWRQGTIEGGWWSGVRSHCLQDADDVPGYEVMWQSAPFLAGSSFALTGLTSRSTLREPVTVSPAPNHTWPSEHLVVRYQGLEGETRDEGGALRPRAVRFVIQIGRAEPQIENWQAIVLPLDAEGGATLVLGGREVARLSNVQVSGVAQLQTLAGLPETAEALVDESETMEGIAERARVLRATFTELSGETDSQPDNAEAPEAEPEAPPAP